MMVTPFDKAIVVILIAIFTWLNQTYGLKLPVDDATLGILVGAVTTAAVYLVPNKKPATTEQTK